MVDTVAFAATRATARQAWLARFDFINKQFKMFNRMTEKCAISDIQQKK